MNAAVLHQSAGGIQHCGCDNSLGSIKGSRNSSLRLFSKRFEAGIGFFRRGNCNSRPFGLRIIRTSASHSLVKDETATSDLSDSTKDSQKTSGLCVCLRLVH